MPPGIHEQLAIELYRQMLYLRVFDERALIYHRHGRIGTWAISWGHEAIQVGAMFALRDHDWAFPSYRENKIGLMRGMSPADVLAGCRGHPQGWWNPNIWRMGSISIPVGSQVPHAVGFAWGERLQGRDTVALVFFGDGATSEGEFHEGANLAGVLNAPAVLLCSNNQWAISTPLHHQTRASSLADKAVGYGIPGVRVDGDDVAAVYLAVSAAVERARSGGGPTFIECVTYRMQAHAFPDDPSVYRDDADAEAARRDECLVRYERYLQRLNLLTPEMASRFREEWMTRMAAAITEAEALPAPDPSLVFDHTYERKTPAMERDLARLKALQAPGAEGKTPGRTP
ncbi:2-oxoisovalerate dehydrogenase subunit alpha [Myxococcus stipitatus]